MNPEPQDQRSTLMPLPGSGVREPALWIGLIGGGIAWLIHFLAVYAIAEFGCVSGWGRGTFLGVTGLSWLLLAVSAIMLGVCTGSVLLARRSLHRLRKASGSGTIPPHSHFFVARTGFISGTLFGLIILVETLPIFFYLQRC